MKNYHNFNQAPCLLPIFSVSYSNKHLVAFICANQLLGTSFTYQNPTYQHNITSQLVPYYLIGLRWNKKLSSDFNNTLTFMSRSHQGLTIQADVSDIVTWKEKLAIGLGYRQTYNTYALARFQVTQNIGVGYSYEYNTHQLNAHSKGGHEFNICYQFNANPKEKESQKKISNKNISDIYDQIEQVTKTLNASKTKTDSLNSYVAELRAELEVLQEKQQKQEVRNKVYDKNLIKTDSIDEALKIFR